MTKKLGLLLALVALTPLGCSTSTSRRGLAPPKTVASVDLSRYLGTWYEIASFPQSFQKGCTGTVATYSPKPDGEVDVLNRCRLDSLDGKEKSARGRARVVDKATGAKLEVSFFGPFWGDYWVVDLDPEYRWAVVGHPSRDYLWILGRTPQMDEAVYAGILSRLGADGWETARLARTLQPKG